MNTIFNIRQTIFVCMAFILCVIVSCEKEQNIPIEAVTMQDTITCTATTAHLKGTYSSRATITELTLLLDTEKDLINPISYPLLLDKQSFENKFVKLTNNTTYYYQYIYCNPVSSSLSQVYSFTTDDYHVPTVETVRTTLQIADTDILAHCVGRIIDDGELPIQAYGFCYSTQPEPIVSDSLITITDSLQADTFKTILSLQPAQTIYLRAYAQTTKGVGYGAPKLISVPNGEVIFGEITISNLTATTANLSHVFTDDGGFPILRQGLCLSKQPNPTLTDSLSTYNLTNLTPNTTYYVRAYLENKVGLQYSSCTSFTTLSGVPTFAIPVVTNITATSAKITCNITADNGATITERGICYATTPNPTTNNTKIVSDSGTGSFTCNLSNLTDGTTYYVRSYAINSKGTYYSEQKTFTTIAYVVPSLTTNTVSSITYTSATCGGNITSDGGQTITARGVCYSTSQNPTISSSKVASGSGTGSFTCNLSGLTEGTTYYVRAYATNSKGTAYGNQQSFTTTAYTLPTVTTNTVTSITYTTASCGGYVNSGGGLTVTARGICYSTSQNPTISNSKVANGSGTGSFTCELSGLTAGTTYYVRAYATNNKGTAYGNQRTFTTTAAAPPTITTDSVKINTALPVGGIKMLIFNENT